MLYVIMTDNNVSTGRLQAEAACMRIHCFERTNYKQHNKILIRSSSSMSLFIARFNNLLCVCTIV
jgi:hypothetical protein